MTRNLFVDPHVTANVDDGAGLVRYIRSRQPYASLEVLREIHLQLKAGLAALPPGKLVLLIDVRDAPARNDDTFEGEIMQALAAIMPRFVAYAVLVKSAVGKLQARRLAKARGQGDPSVFENEAEAVDYLRALRLGQTT